MKKEESDMWKGNKRKGRGGYKGKKGGKRIRKYGVSRGGIRL